MKYAFIFLFIFLSFVISLLLYDDSDTEHTGIYFLLFLILFAAIGFYFYLRDRPKKVSVSSSPISPPSSSNENNDEETKKLLNRLKESKVEPEIHEELFRLNQFLKELHDLLKEDISRHDTEFLYDIDKDIPVEIVGDAVLYKQIFFYILSNLLETHHVETLILTLHKEKKTLLFEIQLNEAYPHKSDHDTEYDFAYAQKLLEQLHGEFISYPWEGIQKRFLIKLPFILPDTLQPNFYKLDKKVSQLQLLLIEEKKDSAAIHTKLFENFGIHVKQIFHHEDIYPALDNEHYDIILIDIDKYPTLLQHHLAKFKEKHGSKILAFHTIQNANTSLPNTNTLIDKYLDRPLTPGMLHDFLYECYGANHDITDSQKQQEPKEEDTSLLVTPEPSKIEPKDFKCFGHAHILIVEDNKINQKILESILSQSDLQISIANHGAEALDILQQEDKIDLVLMDINMPVMDGYDATRKIRQIKQYKYLPIVVVSGLGYRNEIEKMYHIGADAHLSKPFKIEELYEVFENTLATEEQSNSDLPIHIYHENKNILNTTKGLYLQKNILQFRDMLGEMVHRFNHAPEEIKKLLIKESYSELSSYLEMLLKESQDVGAESVKELVTEMKILSDNKEEVLLKSYLPHFDDVWRDTLQQIKAYLEHSRR